MHSGPPEQPLVGTSTSSIGHIVGAVKSKGKNNRFWTLVGLQPNGSGLNNFVSSAHCFSVKFPPRS
jgi:hypothetical protein